MKMVVIGCGWAGNVHATNIKNNPGAELVGVVDKDIIQAERLAKKYNVPFFPELTALLDSNVEFKAAVISAPTDNHFEICKRLIDQGKGIFVEKPLSNEIEEAIALKSMIEKNNTFFGINFNQRFAPSIKRVKEIILDTEVTHLIKANMFQHVPALEKGEVEKYFLITDATCHLIDTLRYINGEIKEVYATGVQLEHNYLTDLVVNFKFENKSIGMITNTFIGGKLDSQHSFQDIEVITNKARYVAQNMYDQLIIYPHDSEYKQVWRPSVFVRRDYNQSIEDSFDRWLNNYLEEKEPPVDIFDGLQNMVIISAIIESLKTNRVVKLD